MLVQEEPRVVLPQRAEPGMLEVPEGQGVQDDCPGLG